MSNTFVISGTVSWQAPLFMEFSRQEYWSGLPFPTGRNLPNTEIQPMSPAWHLDALSLSHLCSYSYTLFSTFYAATTEKAMATHSGTLAWKIPWTAEPGRLQSMGSLRVGHDWAISLSLFTFVHWRREWQPTPVFLHGESQEQKSLLLLLLRRFSRVQLCVTP